MRACQNSETIRVSVFCFVLFPRAVHESGLEGKHEQKQSLFMIETPIKTRCRAARDRTFDGVIAKLIKLDKISKFLEVVGGLVLGCIEIDFASKYKY